MNFSGKPRIPAEEANQLHTISRFSQLLAWHVITGVIERE